MGVSLIVMEAGEELVLSGERQQQTLILASISEGGMFWQVRKVLDVQTQKVRDQDAELDLELLSTPVTMTEILEKDLIKEEGEIKWQKNQILRTLVFEVQNLELMAKLGAFRQA